MKPSIFSSVIWSLLRTWGGRLAGFVIYFQLVRMLTPEEMGLFSAAFAVFVFLEIVADHGLVQAVVQCKTISPAQLNAVLLMNVVAAGLVAACLWLLASPLAAFIGIEHLAPVLQVGCLTLLFSSAGFAQEAMARRRFEFRRLAVRTLVSTVVGGAAGVWMAASGYGVWALVAQLLLSSAVNTAVLWFRPAWNPLVRPDFQGLGQLTRFGIQVTGMRLIEFGATRGAELMIGTLLGAGALGLYAVGTKIHYIFVQLLGLALSDVAQAGYARIRDDTDHLRAVYLSSVRAVAIAATPVWLVLAGTAPETAVVAFGPRWAVCAEVLAPFALLGALQVLQKFDTAALNASGRPGLALLLSAARAAGALLAVWVAHGGGLQAVAHAFVASQIVVTPLNLVLLHRCLRLDWRDWVAQIWRPTLAAIVAWAAMSAACGLEDLTASRPFVRLVVLALLGGSVYFAVMGIIARRHLHGLRAGIRSMRRPAT